MINFESHIPYYIQLIELLKTKIQRKEWTPGQQIPGEQDLCELYSISRTVVRQALRELELDGSINRRKGKGTFVAEPKISEGLIQKLTGFYQDMTDRGLKPVTKVLHQTIVPASEKVAGYLDVTPGTEVVDIHRLRFINDDPIQLVTTYIPYQICPLVATTDFSNVSLYDFLDKEYGIRLARGKRFIEAVIANENEAMLLEIERGAPLLMLDSVSYSSDGRPVEYYHALHRGDRSRFEVELVRGLETV